MKELSMLRLETEIHGYSVHGTDGDLGTVSEFFFEDRSWVIRYLVVSIGAWLSRKKVLIHPEALHPPDWIKRIFPTDLSRDQIRHSPDIDTEMPVSRNQERNLLQYFGWPLYWGESYIGPGTNASLMSTMAAQEAQSQHETDQKECDTHLRSTREIKGYHIQTPQGTIGHVSDFLFEDSSWQIRYIVVNTKNILPGKKVLLSVEWIETIDWPGATLDVSISKEMIKQSPRFDPSQPVNQNYENDLFDYYGRPRKWLK